MHGCVFMDNHYHLLLRMAEETGLSAVMQWLGVNYSVRFNRHHHRCDHLIKDASRPSWWIFWSGASP